MVDTMNLVCNIKHPCCNILKTVNSFRGWLYSTQNRHSRPRIARISNDACISHTSTCYAYQGSRLVLPSVYATGPASSSQRPLLKKTEQKQKENNSKRDSLLNSITCGSSCIVQANCRCVSRACFPARCHHASQKKKNQVGLDMCNFFFSFFSFFGV